MSGDMSNSPVSRKRSWPVWARRGLLENVAIALILIGVFMLVSWFVRATA